MMMSEAVGGGDDGLSGIRKPLPALQCDMMEEVLGEKCPEMTIGHRFSN